MNTPVTPGAKGGPADMDESDEGGDLTAFRVGGLTSQSDIDKYENKYGAALGSNYVAEQTGWDGLTKGQEVQQQERAQAERLLEEQMEDNEQHFQETIAEFERQKEDIREKMKKMEDETYHLHGKAVFTDDLGNPVYGDGTRLEGQDLKDALEAKAQGQKFDNFTEYHQHDHDLKALDTEEQGLLDKHAKNQAAGGTAVEKDKQDILDAQTRLQARDEARSVHDATGAAIAKATTDKSKDALLDFGDFQGDDSDIPSVATATTRNTTVAGQKFGATSDLSSKGPFAAASAPASVAALPAITQENNGSTQRAPTTPSPTAAV